MAERTAIGRQILADSKEEIDQLAKQLAEEMDQLVQVDRTIPIWQRQQRIQTIQQSLLLKKVKVLNRVGKEVEAIVAPLAEKKGYAAVLARGTTEFKFHYLLHKDARHH